MKLKVLFTLIFLISLQAYSYGQSNDTVTISTYYPSPMGVYREMEAKKSMAVGDITASGNTTYDSISDLTAGQLYIGQSIIFKSLAANPSVSPKPGQVIYNTNDRMLKFYNGSAWVNATGGSTTSCLTGQPCASCPAGQTCEPPCTATCPAGQSCLPPCTATCPVGQSCLPPCPSCQTGQPCSACPAGQTCQPPGSTYVTTLHYYMYASECNHPPWRCDGPGPCTCPAGSSPAPGSPISTQYHPCWANGQEFEYITVCVR